MRGHLCIHKSMKHVRKCLPCFRLNKKHKRLNRLQQLRRDQLKAGGLLIRYFHVQRSISAFLVGTTSKFSVTPCARNSEGIPLKTSNNPASCKRVPRLERTWSDLPIEEQVATIRSRFPRLTVEAWKSRGPQDVPDDSREDYTANSLSRRYPRLTISVSIQEVPIETIDLTAAEDVEEDGNVVGESIPDDNVIMGEPAFHGSSTEAVANSSVLRDFDLSFFKPSVVIALGHCESVLGSPAAVLERYLSGESFMTYRFYLSLIDKFF